MSTLTDRYVYAVVRSLPEQQRADIERELRASISDSVDARVDSGEAADAAETDTLLELGDPDRLAAGYADRPTFLVGPQYFFDYVRLLKVLYAIVLPISVVAIAAALFIAGKPVGEMVGTTIATTITVGVHMGFWTTLVFAVLDRTAPEKRGPITPWTPSNLPALPSPQRYGVVDLVATIVMVLFFVGAVVWQQSASVFQDEAGAPIPVLNPALWNFWLPYFFVIGALEILFVISVYRAGRWTVPLAWINVPLGLAYAIPAIWLLATNQVFNAPFLAALKFSESTTATITLIFVAIAAIFTVWDFIDGALKARRALRAS